MPDEHVTRMQDSARVSALQAALAKERSRSGTLKKQLASLIAAGQADLALRSSGPQPGALPREESADSAASRQVAQAEVDSVAEARCAPHRPSVAVRVLVIWRA